MTQFHLYTIEWEPTEIRWYVDRATNPTPVHTVSITAANREEFQRSFHVILNLALSGQFTGWAEPNPADFATKDVQSSCRRYCHDIITSNSSNRYAS